MTRVVQITPALERALKQAMAENMLEDGYRGFVLQYLARKDDAWRRCCDAGCDPCVLKLGRVVDRTRELLGED
jgi:hypothetical protein